MNWFLYNLLFVTVAANAYAYEKGFCCPEQEYVVKTKQNDTSTRECWDHLGTNTTSITSVISCPINEARYIKMTKTKWSVTDEGALVIDTSNGAVIHKSRRFCVGKFAPLMNISAAIDVAYVCVYKTVFGIKVYGYLEIISAVSLFITCVIYSVVPELRDVQGKNIRIFVLCLGIGLSFMASLKLQSYLSTDPWCPTRGFLAYYFRITVCFWITAIWCQIVQFYISNRRVTDQRFICYAAFGLPGVLTAIVIIINFIPGDHIKPGIGLDTCWFSYGENRRWVYMYSIMIILIIVNITVLVAAVLYKMRYVQPYRNPASVLRDYQTSIILCVLMMCLWTVEFWESVANPSLFWEIVDLMYCLRGVLVSLVLLGAERQRLLTCLRYYRQGGAEVSGTEQYDEESLPLK